MFLAVRLVTGPFVSRSLASFGLLLRFHWEEIEPVLRAYVVDLGHLQDVSFFKKNCVFGSWVEVRRFLCPSFRFRGTHKPCRVSGAAAFWAGDALLFCSDSGFERARI